VAAAPAADGARAPNGIGSAGLGDRFYPLAGNGGYEVDSYRVRLGYDPGEGRLDAAVRIRAVAEHRLRRFNLDFRGLRIQSLRVAGRRARFRRHGQELVINPATSLAKGRRFRVDVRYGGVPQPRDFPLLGDIGWIATDDGAFVASEPNGTPTWLPCNDHPSDKATYRFRVTVPAGSVAVANGRLQGLREGRDLTTYRWREDRPMATYVATVNIGEGPLTDGAWGELPYWNFVDHREVGEAQPVLDQLESILRTQEESFGRYPFDSAGLIVDHDVDYPAALETQTRPLFSGRPDPPTVAHELGHQWFGNSVSVRRWRDIWLSEGFAEFSTWMWAERTGQGSAQQIFEDYYENGERIFGEKLWNPPPARPGTRRGLFSFSVYTRGAMTLQALRSTLGDQLFFGILRRWSRINRYGNASVGQFTDFAERESGRDLDRFFHEWLERPGKPRWPLPE
jgi:aminopeptidase N